MTIPEELLKLSVPSVRDLICKGEALNIPLIILNVFSWSIIIDRIVFWVCASVRMFREKRLIAEYVRDGHADGFEGFLKARYPAARLEKKLSRSIYTGVALVADKFRGDDKMWEDEMDAVLGRSERFLGFLTLIASLSTSFGLFGTVVGVSWSLNYIESDFSQTVSGLSVALYTTILGLAVSIVAIIASGMFGALSEMLGKSIISRVNTVRRAAGRLPESARPVSATARSAGGEPGQFNPFRQREDTLDISPAKADTRKDLSKSDFIVEEI